MCCHLWCWASCYNSLLANFWRPRWLSVLTARMLTVTGGVWDQFISWCRGSLCLPQKRLNAYVSVSFGSMKSLLIAPIMFDTAWPFISYLSSKEFTVSIGQHVSFCGSVICGVAQGSPVELVLLPWYMLTLVHTIWHVLNRANHLRLMASITVFCRLAAIARCTYNGGKTLLWTLCRLKRCFRTDVQLTG